ncbi:hypothetical protein FW764_28195, partial [Pseudomonas sp. 1152_12]
MTTPTDSTVDISLEPPRATFAIALDELDYPEKAKWALGLHGIDPSARFSSEAWSENSIGDIFYVCSDGKVLSQDTVTTKAPRYFLTVAMNTLIPSSQQEGLVEIYWEVLRKSNGQISRSPTETYLIKKTHPAGIDRRPDISGHDGLRVVAESFPEHSDFYADTAANGMWTLVYKHQNARMNDLVSVLLDGFPTYYRLSAAEAAGAGPYRVFIKPSTFQKIS